MTDSQKTKEVIAALEKFQATGITLTEAIKQLYKNESVAFDDIWPAVMQIEQVSEREAMRLTKDGCL